MIEKKDWEAALKQYEAQLINAQVNIAAIDFMVEHTKKKISEFPEEDPMPKEVKDLVK